MLVFEKSKSSPQSMLYARKGPKTMGVFVRKDPETKLLNPNGQWFYSPDVAALHDLTDMTVIIAKLKELVQ